VSAEQSPIALPLLGGGFLLGPVSPSDVVTPEDPMPEAERLAERARAFARDRVFPNLPALERPDTALLKALLHEAGEAGLFGADVPKAYGGLGIGRLGTVRVAEALSPTGGFAVAHGAQVGIGSLPIVFFGTEAQKARYLPRLVSGEWIGAFALTEPETGSDALHARATARPADDGDGYVISGHKQWITNAGVADLFTVFAQLEGVGLTAFLVERTFSGVRVGPEYRKMGIHSSSTCPVFLEGVRVPAENVLGEPGKGHQVALGVLNFGRLTLAAGTLGSAKAVLGMAVDHARGRRQFERPIADLPLIREKLARMQVRTWALESSVYRTAGLTQAAVERGGSMARALSEYAVECALNKVYGSETLDFVVDEAVQIHGGFGYMQESPVERAYRDARINRIFEGTNEINRLSIADTLFRRALRGQLPFLQRLSELEAALARTERPAPGDDLAEEAWLVENMKALAVLAAGRAAERLGMRLADEQEILVAVADMTLEAFVAESSLLRAEKVGGERPALLARLAVRRGARRVRSLVEKTLAAVLAGERLHQDLATADRRLAPTPADEIALRRRVAAWVVEAGGYVSGAGS
jgi:alkylation response protein AidB-like acyl-CoA dehydrogenase